MTFAVDACTIVHNARAHLVAALALGLLVPAMALAGPNEAAIDPGLLAMREAAWRSWFTGDTAVLARVLPEDFIGIAWTDGPFADRAATLAASKAFVDGGGRLVRLTFPETRAHHFGDAVVLYGRFEIVLVTARGEQTVRGRLTETFVKRDGRWWHPAWHLDAVTTTAP